MVFLWFLVRIRRAMVVGMSVGVPMVMIMGVSVGMIMGMPVGMAMMVTMTCHFR